jgi:hypothetical protein
MASKIDTGVNLMPTSGNESKKSEIDNTMLLASKTMQRHQDSINTSEAAVNLSKWALGMRQSKLEQSSLEINKNSIDAKKKKP